VKVTIFVSKISVSPVKKALPYMYIKAFHNIATLLFSFFYGQNLNKIES